MNIEKKEEIINSTAWIIPPKYTQILQDHWHAEASAVSPTYCQGLTSILDTRAWRSRGIL